jgi:hypothetical protein
VRVFVQWAQQPFNSEAFALCYVATAVHKGIAAAIPGVPAVDPDEVKPNVAGPKETPPQTPPERPVVVQGPAQPAPGPLPGTAAPQLQPLVPALVSPSVGLDILPARNPISAA